MTHLPQCIIPFTAAEIADFDHWSHEQNADEQLAEIIAADCWAIVIVKDGEPSIKFNVYRDGREHNWSIEEEEMLSVGDRVDLYMFGIWCWRLTFTKTATGYEHRYFKTAEGVDAPWDHPMDGNNLWNQ